MLKRIVRNFIYREKASSDKFVAYLRNKGIQVGEDVTFYSPIHTHIDVSCPWLLSIGDHVRITHGVIILTHDYSWSVLKRIPENVGKILGAQSAVTIGNNVFIGMNAVITRGVKIGDNVIIGAGSVVTKDCESNGVYAGSPAKKIMTITEYLYKREAQQLEEAKRMARKYFEHFGTRPPKEVFREYFMLFCNADEAMQIPEFLTQMKTGYGFEECETYMRANPPAFQSYEAFLEACFSDN